MQRHFTGDRQALALEVVSALGAHLVPDTELALLGPPWNQ